MKKFILFIIFFCNTTAYAQNNLVVLGNGDCGVWLKARKTNQAKFLEQSMLGLINGMVLGRSIDIWMVRGSTVSPDQLYFWMDAYCQKNPLNNTFGGAVEFAEERTNGEYKKNAPK